YTDPTGLIKFGARYYDPTTARWTQTDPAWNGTSSPYGYADDSPTNGTDWTGTFCCFGHWQRFTWWGAYGQFWFYLNHYDVVQYPFDSGWLVGALAIGLALIPVVGWALAISAILLAWWYWRPIVAADARTGRGAWAIFTWWKDWWTPWWEFSLWEVAH
ncbi:MAG: RHS repeat-associated core domain-containing protein, partial [Candidatus Dormibacterales bacterium]